jgi:hypothetical protein
MKRHASTHNRKKEDMKFKPYLNQSYSELKQTCLKSNTLFEDHLFPATRNSLFKKKKHDQKVSSIFWLRPHQFVDKPQLVIGNKFSATHICQGQLGDWSVGFEENFENFSSCHFIILI